MDAKALTYEARFKVFESWKGIESETVSVFGGTECCFCQYEFEVAESYLVYASVESADENKLRTSICTRTKPLSNAAIDLKYLGKKKKGGSGRQISTVAKPDNSFNPSPR